MTYQFEEYPTRAALIEKLSQALIADLRKAEAERCPFMRFVCPSELSWHCAPSSMPSKA